jgi:hypothetical protein
MLRVPFTAVFWTFAIAVPLTIISLAGVAYVDLHFSEIALAIARFEFATSATGRGWVAEFSARAPELVGMVIGLIVILTSYIFVRRPSKGVNASND